MVLIVQLGSIRPSSALINAAQFELTEPDQSKQDAKGCHLGAALKIAKLLHYAFWESWKDGFSAANSCSVSPTAMDVHCFCSKLRSKHWISFQPCEIWLHLRKSLQSVETS